MTGSVEPRPGMDPDFDACIDDMAARKAELEGLLKDLKASGPLAGSGVKWWHHKTKLDDMCDTQPHSRARVDHKT